MLSELFLQLTVFVEFSAFIYLLNFDTFIIKTTLLNIMHFSIQTQTKILSKVARKKTPKNII